MEEVIKSVILESKFAHHSNSTNDALHHNERKAKVGQGGHVEPYTTHTYIHTYQADLD